MEEVLFENSHTRNKALAKELYSYYYFKRKGAVICNIIILLCFFISFVNTILGVMYSRGLMIFILLLCAYRVFGYFHNVKMMLKRDYEVHGKEITVNTIVTEDYIQNTASTGAIIKLEYSNIHSAVHTQNLILIRSKANMVWIFTKSGFTKGTQEQFIAFLSGKGLKIK